MRSTPDVCPDVPFRAWRAAAMGLRSLSSVRMSRLRSELRWEKVACQGIVQNPVREWNRGPASPKGYAVTNNDLSRPGLEPGTTGLKVHRECNGAEERRQGTEHVKT